MAVPSREWSVSLSFLRTQRTPQWIGVMKETISGVLPKTQNWCTCTSSAGAHHVRSEKGPFAATFFLEQKPNNQV